MVEDEERPVFDRLDGIAIPAASRSVVGHDGAMSQLTSAHRAGRLHHAWMISGPRGVGKSTLALNFAKHLFAHPAGAHAPEAFDGGSISDALHGSVSQGSHNQLLHLTRPWDPKGERFKTQLSVDEIRRTVPFYGMTAGGGGYRVTIIDAADDMNTSAANAVLKMLEEPPAKSIFFVLAHAPGSLLPTIRSRCRVLPLDPLSPENISSILNTVSLDGAGEGSGDAARLAQGSVRRAIQLQQGDVLKFYSQFESLMKQPKPGEARDWVAVHMLADNLSKRGGEAAYDLFIELVLDWIASRVRENPNVPVAWMARWADLHTKVRDAVRLAGAYNLDKKQVLLNLFSDLFSVARS
ncbi:DNA polymerase III subunit delta' [Ahrensia sp. R2A130]|uniref:DNA polymerase III subunit delta' n=1 Tax=Ahrensia sp. R2A130 TaxID=744979 RepID=UPI0001E0C9AE|nr:DNA polymerase III subunit delta' [Ahrensia sp. R2A130]EFL90263.1 DNA polymerase III subunit delta' [Ahrensia sp. R2A130]